MFQDAIFYVFVTDDRRIGFRDAVRCIVFTYCTNLILFLHSYKYFKGPGLYFSIQGGVINFGHGD
jgi:hypothetical protein